MLIKNKQKGFTLVEILIAAVVTIFLAGGILTLQYLIGQNQVSAWKNFIGVNEANLSINSLIKELRTARSGENAAYPLEKATSNEIVFYSDTDFDGVVEKVRYFLTDTTFAKGIIEPSGSPVTYPSSEEKVKTISDVVRNGTTPVFYYYNSNWPTITNGNPLTSPASPVNVKLIKIYLRLNSDTSKAQSDFVIENFIQIRMLKNNL